MANGKIEEVYELIRRLPAFERLRLVEQIAHELSSSATEGAEELRFDWSGIAGSAPGLLEGEDAQAWVSRTRREGDERRENELRGRR